MGSFSIGRVFGIEVRIHILFPVLLFLMGLANGIELGYIAGLLTILFMLCLFGSVFLHEMGHSLVARYYGLKIKDITLWPLGGFASIENTDELRMYPFREIKISLSGPAVNLALALVLTPIALVTYFLAGWHFFIYVIGANITLMLFNLLPAFPMDGGRIYRAWRSRRLSYLVATEEAVKLSTFIAIVLGLAGILFFRLELLLIAIFIIIFGKQELRGVQMKTYRQNFFNGEPSQNPFYIEIEPDKFRESGINEEELLARLRRFLNHRWPYN